MKCFISYKWQDEEHNRWVERFARNLRERGVDAQLDKWELRAGDSLTEYMTSKIDQSSVILCIVTDEFVQSVEAPAGEGGATKFEMQLAVSRRTGGDAVRIIGIYRQGTKQPHYLRDHLYIDFRDESLYEQQLKILIDDIRGISRRPPLDFPSILPLETWTNSLGMEMTLIPSGHLDKGRTIREKDGSKRIDWDGIQFVEFLFCQHPVTQDQYRQIVKWNPSHFKGNPNRPVEQVSWRDAVLFCNQLSLAENLSPFYEFSDDEQVSVIGGGGYRLPTDHEWDYALKTDDRYWRNFRSGEDDSKILQEYSWCVENSEGTTQPVGKKLPNPWGLHDMLGSVYNICWTAEEENVVTYEERRNVSICGGAFDKLEFNSGGGVSSSIHSFEQDDRKKTRAFDWRVVTHYHSLRWERGTDEQTIIAFTFNRQGQVNRVTLSADKSGRYKRIPAKQITHTGSWTTSRIGV